MQGDVLLARITPCLENGKTALVDILAEGEAGAGSTEFIVMRGRGPVPSAWVYCLARSPYFREYAIRGMTGSSGRQRVSAEVVRRFQIARPPEEMLRRFAEVAAPLFSRISIKASQSRTLTSLRDLLLPKLISGQLRVPKTLDQALEILKIVRDTNNTSIASQMRGKPYADWSRLQDWIGATDPRNDYFFRGRMDAFGKPIPNFPDPYTPRTSATTPQAAAPAATGYTPNNVKWDGKNWTDGTHKWDANGKLVK